MTPKTNTRHGNVVHLPLGTGQPGDNGLVKHTTDPEAVRLIRLSPFKKPDYIPDQPYPTKKSVTGYEDIGQVIVSYDQQFVDVGIPAAKSRGLVFDTIEGKNEFRLTFCKIPGALHKTYESLGADSVLNNLIAGRTYAVPDDMDRLKAPLPKIYDVRKGRVMS